MMFGRYVSHLEKEIELLRKDNAFLAGKCERLELALMSQTPIAAAQNYAQRTDSPISDTVVPVEPEKKTWKQFSAEWSKLSESEQVEKLGWKEKH